jgi:hypothetical protein
VQDEEKDGQKSKETKETTQQGLATEFRRFVTPTYLGAGTFPRNVVILVEKP